MRSDAIEQARQSLVAFASGSKPSGGLLEYCRFYGIDFGSSIEGVTHTLGTVQSGSFSVAVHRWSLEGASKNLLVVHGYLDHTGLFSHVIEFGLKQGCNVVCFDLPGHGLSSGDPAAIDDFSSYSQAIADVMDNVCLPALPWWSMAQSTGCAALIDFASKHSWPFDATVLMAPLIRPAAWTRMRLAYFLIHRFAKSVTRTFVVNSNDAEFLDFLKADPLQSHRISVRWVGALRNWLAKLALEDLGVGPALVLQGDQDGTVDWRYNMAHIGSLFPGSTIEYLPGARHQLANESEALRQQYFDKVTDYLNKTMA